MNEIKSEYERNIKYGGLFIRANWFEFNNISKTTSCLLCLI